MLSSKSTSVHQTNRACRINSFNVLCRKRKLRSKFSFHFRRGTGQAARSRGTLARLTGGENSIESVLAVALTFLPKMRSIHVNWCGCQTPCGGFVKRRSASSRAHYLTSSVPCGRGLQLSDSIRKMVRLMEIQALCGTNGDAPRSINLTGQNDSLRSVVQSVLVVNHLQKFQEWFKFKLSVR